MLSAKSPDSKLSMHAVALKCRILLVLLAGGCSIQSVHFHMQAGAFRIGDTAGTLDNIAACKLHRPGSVGFVSKSGGMSNEMYNVLSRTTDGLYEGERLDTDQYSSYWQHSHIPSKGDWLLESTVQAAEPDRV